MKQQLPQKQLVYEALHGVNEHFDQLLVDRQRFADLGLLKPADLKGLASIIEETRAWINFKLVELMQRREEEDWAKYSHLRMLWERKHEDPNDILVKARRLIERRSKKGRITGEKPARSPQRG
jgi:hypothetical protein